MSAVDQIRKLLEIARSAGNTAEGRTARRKAEDRMRRAGLSEQEVMRRERVVASGRIRIWEQSLLRACAEVEGCGLEHRKGSDLWVVTGSAAATDRALFRTSSIRGQLREAAAEYLVELAPFRLPPKLRRAASLAFLESAMISVSIRAMAILASRPEGVEGDGSACDDLERREVEEADPTALLEEKVEEAAEGFELPPGARNPVEAGLAAGEEVDLDPPAEEPLVLGRLEIRPEPWLAE